MRKTDSDRCSLIKGQLQLSGELCLVSNYSYVAGEGEKGCGMMNNDFIIHVGDRNSLFFTDCMHYITK